MYPLLDHSTFRSIIRMLLPSAWSFYPPFTCSNPEEICYREYANTRDILRLENHWLHAKAHNQLSKPIRLRHTIEHYFVRSIPLSIDLHQPHHLCQCYQSLILCHEYCSKAIPTRRYPTREIQEAELPKLSVGYESSRRDVSEDSNDRAERRRVRIRMIKQKVGGFEWPSGG